MADKPPKAEGQVPKRRKTAPPTIDLTASEQIAEPAAAAPPAEEIAAAPVSPQAERPEAASMPPIQESLPRGVPGTALAAGAAGAAAMFILLLAAWWLILPQGEAGSAAMQTRIDALQTRSDALQTQIHALENRPAPAVDAGLTDRLSAAENAMKAVGLTLAALNRRSDDIADTAAKTRDSAEAAQKAVADLRVTIQDVVKIQTTAASGDSEALQARLAALEQATKTARDAIAGTAAANNAARLALSAASLRDAVTSGAPFAAELAQVRALGGDAAPLAALQPFAATGLPTPQVLAQQLRALIPVLLKSSGAQASGGFLERLQANASHLVKVQPLDKPPGDDPSAVLARVEIDAANTDLTGAVNDLNKLSDAARAPAQDWIAKAQARQTALSVVAAYAASASRALAQP